MSERRRINISIEARYAEAAEDLAEKLGYHSGAAMVCELCKIFLRRSSLLRGKEESEAYDMGEEVREIFCEYEEAEATPGTVHAPVIRRPREHLSEEHIIQNRGSRMKAKSFD